jgi:ABC-type Zn uptake system ZnuABC Zn-binding protein ZnuA
MRSLSRALVAVLASLALVLAACGGDDDVAAGDDDGATDGESGGESGGDRPTVVVTTNILGDVVGGLVGDELEVVTIMPVGADPHAFQASAQQVAQIGEADALIVNGAGFEEGLLDVIESAEADGVPIFEAISVVETIEFGEEGHEHAHEDEHADDEHAHEDEHADDEHAHEDEHADDEHADEDEHADDEHAHEDEHAHHHEGTDPHFFTDPERMALAANGIVEFLVASAEGVDAPALEANAEEYIAEIEALDAEVEETFAAIPEDQRVLVTNHQVFGYLADRYDFEVVGTVIPSGSTVDGASADALAELAEVIEHEGVPAIFADTSSSDEIAQTLADEVGDIEVIELFSESLGPDDSDGATYLDMVRANAERIADALAG